MVRKIKMEKIKNKDYLRVVYSKRKADLLKRASELCTVCDVHIALIMFSPAKSGKVTSFGLPDFHGPITSSFAPDYFGVSQKKNYMQFLNNKFTEVTAEKQKELKIKKMLGQNEKKNKSSETWWRSKYPKDFTLVEAIQMKEAFEAMKKEVHDVITSHLVQTIPNYYVGSSSNVVPPFATNNHMLPFGFDSMNGTLGGYNDYSQIQNQVFEQAHPHYHQGPRFF